MKVARVLSKSLQRERQARLKLEAELAARQRVEAALRVSETRLRIASEAMRGLIYEWNLHTREVYRSEGLFSLLGFHPEEISDNSSWWFSRVHPDDKAAMTEFGERTLRGELDALEVEYRIAHRDGRYIWVWDNQRVLRDDDGTPTRVIGWTISIDDRKRAEAHTSRLNLLAAALARASTPQEVTAALMAHLRDESEIITGVLRVLNEEETHLDILDQFGYSPEMLDQWGSIAMDDTQALGPVALREYRSIWLQTAEECAQLAPIWQLHPDGQQAPPTLAVVPFNVNDTLRGVLVIAYTSDHQFTEDEKNYIEAIADNAAQALQRARLAEQRREFVAWEERQKLARDLHDAVSQILFAATSMADSLPRTWERDPARGRLQVEEVAMLNRAAMAEMRKLLLELRPEAIVRTPFETLLDHLGRAVRGTKEIAVDLQTGSAKEVFLPPDVHVACYRIAQEALNNVVKHSRAGRVTLMLTHSAQQFTAEIHDDGVGFDPTAISAGIGTNSMRERAAAAGVQFALSSAPGNGTRVRLVWP